MKQCYCIATCQLFGSGNPPFNFCRYPDWCCHVLSCFYAVLAVHCVDDILSVERAQSAFSGFRGWRDFAEFCGWDIPDSKSPPPAAVFNTLGAETDLSGFPDDPVLLRASKDRIEKLVVLLNDVVEAGFLKPALAGKLFGKLMFMSSQYYGRCGRALLRAFARRQHDLKHNALNPQLRASCLCWLSAIRTTRPREVPMDLASLPCAVSYSDGEGADAGVGIALWVPGRRAVAGYLQVPDSVRTVWQPKPRTPGDERDIYEIEAVGPLLVLSNWGHMLEGMLWIHFVDNEAALAGLIKGSSSVTSGEVITAFTHNLVAKHSVWPWFDRVDTKSNPVDQLSRKKSDGDWDLLPITFPSLLSSQLSSYLS